jgi:hypothetical protein
MQDAAVTYESLPSDPAGLITLTPLVGSVRWETFGNFGSEEN